MIVAAAGIVQTLPGAFPTEFVENAGNMVHGTAPFRMFRRVADVRLSDWRRYYDAPTVVDFVNNQCSHFVYSFANFIQFDNHREVKREAYRNLMRSLDRFSVPIVPFGIGAQSPDHEILPERLPDEAIEFMKFLGERCSLISVRGEFTARVFRELAGVTNTFVTGCPSFFQNPGVFKRLRAESTNPSPRGLPAYSGTNYHRALEAPFVQRALSEGHFWVEVGNRDVHAFHVDSALGEGAVEPLPIFGRPSDSYSEKLLRAYFASKYRIFRDTESWYDFIGEYVSFAYGTRFHGNMAALHGGKRALWLQHDSRTIELTETLHLPRMPIAKAADRETEELLAAASYEEMFDHLQGLYSNFNEYLTAHGLPALELDF